MGLEGVDRILVKEFLESEHDRFNRPEFIVNDPISIPHRYSKKADREISGFLTATISWGQRQTILKNANRLMLLMDDVPCDFVSSCSQKEMRRFADFVHRTFNGTDCVLFVRILSNLYKSGKGLHQIFSQSYMDSNGDMGMAIHLFRQHFWSGVSPGRSAKHFSDPMNQSAAKRLNMFLRWMVRKDDRGVDFGLWTDIPTSALMCPLDVHSGRVARELGLLDRNQNDWQAVTELSNNLRLFDAEDPCRYDYALFGGGVFERSHPNH